MTHRQDSLEREKETQRTQSGHHGLVSVVLREWAKDDAFRHSEILSPPNCSLNY